MTMDSLKMKMMIIVINTDPALFSIYITNTSDL